MPESDVRQLFNQKAGTWEEKYASNGPLRHRLPRFATRIGRDVQPGGSILDIGCGSGSLAGHLSAMGYSVTACDIAEKMIDEAVRTSQSTTIAWRLLPPFWNRLPFESNTFDAIVASSVFEYVDSVDDVLAECGRTLRPGGALIFTAPNPQHYVRKIESFFRPAAVGALRMRVIETGSEHLWLSHLLEVIAQPDVRRGVEAGRCVSRADSCRGLARGGFALDAHALCETARDGACRGGPWSRVKQILQSLRTGVTEVADVPCPVSRRGHTLIRSTRTLVSPGTERMLVEFGKAGWIEKARQQPDKVQMVVNKIKTDGLVPTLQAVFNKLDQPVALGYCSVGEALDVGLGVTGISVGDRVVSNGKHAEVVSVPLTLCAKVPEGVSSDEAAFTVIGAIGLQGIRLVQPTLGEAVVVTGLGLVGLVTVQLLRANGCRVLGIDFDAEKLALARQFGAEVVNLSAGEDPIAAANAFSRGRGVDAVIITASTKSNQPIHQAALMCRKRGRIVLVGVTGLELSRADFFEKELTFQVSCSYGPGRHDSNYEEKGLDYPFGFVRWTEQRNFEAVLDMMADGRLNVKPLISHRFAIGEARRAYELIGGTTSSLGILLHYPTADEKPETELRQSTVALGHHSRRSQRASEGETQATVAFIGSGNYASAVLMPAFKEAGAELRTVASIGGVSGVHAGRKFGFEQATTDTNSVFFDPHVNTVVITTRHDSHARFVGQALKAGKHVFVEKPLALTLDELSDIERAHAASCDAGHNPMLMVGFNRRFAPQVQKMKSLLAGVKEPKAIVMTVNAGAIPPEHWTQDPLVGGGRIVGEACHFIDLLRFLTGSPISGFQAASIGKGAGMKVADDKASMTLRFEDGSIGTIHYLANGHTSFQKERVEVFAGGRILQLANYRKLKGYGWPGFRTMNLWRQDKGQKACAAAFVQAVEQGGAAPIPLVEILEVSRVSIEVAESLR